MRKIWLLLFCMVFLSGPVLFAADKPLGVEEFTSIEELAVSLSSYFPKVQGEVKAVQGDRLTLALGKKDGLMPGMELTLWRDGREILHPVTKAVLGRAEDEVGTIEVVSVSGESTSTALVKKALKDPKQGDRARITSRKINVALIPLRDERPEIVQSLAERLNEFGRFNVLDTAKTNAFIKNSKTRDAALVKEIGRAFGLDAVISLGIYPTEGKLMVTARIFYSDDASQLDTIVAMLNLDMKQSALGEVKPFFVPQQEQEKVKAVLPELPFMARFFVSGDLDGDGRPEYAFSDGTRVHIYRDEPSGWRELWTEVLSGATAVTLEWKELAAVPQGETSIQHINLDLGDINGDGRPELFVTAMVNGKVVSYTIEFVDGAYRRTAEMPGFFRVTPYPGKGTVLLGMAYDPATFFAGRPRQYVWSGGNYAAGEEVHLPAGLGLYGWTFAEVGERRPLLVAFDEDDKLLVYSGDGLVWKSADQYPAVDNYIYLPTTGVDAALHRSGGNDKGRRVRLRPRLIPTDLNGDGRDEIVLVKNLTSMFLGGFTSAELDGLGWTGSRMDAAWSIKEIPGPVFDLRSGLKQGTGTRVHVLVQTAGGIFTKDRQQLMSYVLK